MLINRFIISTVLFVVLSTLTMQVYALPFNIVPKTGTLLPSNVTAAQNAIAYYTVQNNTQTARNKTYVKSLPENVSQITSAGTYSDTCGSTFNLTPTGQAGDSCTLQLSISGPVSSSSPNQLFVCLPGGTACAGTAYPLDVTLASQASLTAINVTPVATTIYQGTTQQYSAATIYSDNSTADATTLASWHTADPTVATISTLGLATAMNIGSTSLSATFNGITGTTPLTVVSTPLVTVTLNQSAIATASLFTLIFSQNGYGTNVLSAMLPAGMTFVGTSHCTVTQGESSCSLSVNSGTTAGVYSISPELISGSATVVASPNPLTISVISPLFLYVSDYSNLLHKCPINVISGSFISSCALLDNQSSPFANTSGIKFNTFSSQRYAYIGDASSSLWKCPVGSNGNFSASCTALTSNTGTPFASTRNTTFYTFSGTTYAYVSDDSTVLWQCPVNSTTGNFSGACTPLNITNNSSSEIFNTTFATFSGVTYAYVADHSSSLWLCRMDSTTGGLYAPCTQLINSSPFTATLSVAFNTANGTSYAYLTDDSPNIWQCAINPSTGGFAGLCSTLTNTNSAFVRTTTLSFNIFSGTTYAYVIDQSSAIWQCSVDATNGSFGSSCTTINSDPTLTNNLLGASFYAP